MNKIFSTLVCMSILLCNIKGNAVEKRRSGWTPSDGRKRPYNASDRHLRHVIASMVIWGFTMTGGIIAAALFVPSNPDPDAKSGSQSSSSSSSL